MSEISRTVRPLLFGGRLPRNFRVVAQQAWVYCVGPKHDTTFDDSKLVSRTKRSIANSDRGAIGLLNLGGVASILPGYDRNLAEKQWEKFSLPEHPFMRELTLLICWTLVYGAQRWKSRRRFYTGTLEVVSMEKARNTPAPETLFEDNNDPPMLTVISNEPEE